MIKNKQSNNETFIDTQRNKEAYNWNIQLDSNLAVIASTIKVIQEHLIVDKLEKFNNKSIPQLRTLYKEIKDSQKNVITDFRLSQDRYKTQQDDVQRIMTLINGWFRTSGICLVMDIEYHSKFYGQARLINKFSLRMSNDFQEIKIWKSTL